MGHHAVFPIRKGVLAEPPRVVEWTVWSESLDAGIESVSRRSNWRPRLYLLVVSERGATVTLHPAPPLFSMAHTAP